MKVCSLNGILMGKTNLQLLLYELSQECRLVLRSTSYQGHGHYFEIVCVCVCVGGSVLELANLGRKRHPMDIVFTLFPSKFTMDFPLSSTENIIICNN